MVTQDDKILANHYFSYFKFNLTLMNECFKNVSSQTPFPETEFFKVQMALNSMRENFNDLQRVLRAHTQVESPIGIHPALLPSKNPTVFKRKATLSDEMPLKKVKCNDFPPEWS